MAWHPYLERPAHCFWRRNVADVPHAEVDPFNPPKFRISRDDLVVSAGSCFAQHIGRHLRAKGFNFYITETLHPIASHLSHQTFGYGLFSARYGNVYTARQLLQLIQRAYGLFKPQEDRWIREDGRLVDPFRPTIQPNGFVSDVEFRRDREQHFAAVRRAIEDMDLFVFTLGLTEAWLSAEDGAAYPVCPGVSGGIFDPHRHRFVNFSLSDVVADLKQCMLLIRRRNRKARILLTVSPVPMVATMEDKSILVATTYSKSVLRVAAEEVANGDADIAYFPSYEVITGAHARGRYFASDLRSVTEEGVAHVMRLFMKHYALVEAEAIVVPSEQARPISGAIEQVVKTICDEEALDAGSRMRL